MTTTPEHTATSGDYFCPTCGDQVDIRDCEYELYYDCHKCQDTVILEICKDDIWQQIFEYNRALREEEYCLECDTALESGEWFICPGCGTEYEIGRHGRRGTEFGGGDEESLEGWTRDRM